MQKINKVVLYLQIEYTLPALVHFEQAIIVPLAD
jgi:hypothetical protein